MAEQLPSRHIHILPNPPPNPNMPLTINVPHCPVLLSINTPSSSRRSSSSINNSHHDKTVGGHLHHQTSTLRSQTILQVRLLPLK